MTANPARMNITEAAAKRDAAIKAAQDHAWNERCRIIRECGEAIEAAWAEYRRQAHLNLHRVVYDREAA